MKKADLRTGMWVEFRNGEIGMVLLGSIEDDIIADKKWHCWLKDVNENLESTTKRVYDIMKIYLPVHPQYYTCFDKNNTKLLWERKEEKFTQPINLHLDIHVDDKVNIPELLERVKNEIKRNCANYN